MTLILCLIFAILIFGVMLLLSIVRGVSSFIFGKSSAYSGSSSGHGSSSRKSSAYNPFGGQETKKVFSKDEGEYVSYEEIKE
jgi:hypothetical protein